MTGRLLAAASAAAIASGASFADEGMWTPDQLPDIAEALQAEGLELDPNTLTDLTAFPMGAVISLGGCTASFVSPQGLVVTNHHCARGSIQFNSTEENNYLRDGFLARNLSEELPAAPGSRVYVTVAVTDVTDRVTGDLGEDMDGRTRFQAIEDRQKEIIEECEAQQGHRCQVASFYGGASYRLIDRLEIRDVRLAYAPADMVGRYGGDDDNWLWPRHTGDFSFYRAYVGPDGQPADYAEENVPFAPAHVLRVSAAGLSEGDFVMAAGYPGTTRRYARLSEVTQNFDWYYPNMQALLQDWIATIEGASAEGSDARIRYESRLQGLANFEKNIGGQITGARRGNLAERRAEREAALDAWVAADRARADYAEAIAAMDALVAENNAAARQDFWFDNARRPQLLAAAQRLYRLAHERALPDAEREPGYQERDMAFFTQGLQRIERRYHPEVDRAEWLLFLERYMGRPSEERVAAFDQAMGLPAAFDADTVGAILDAYYDQTSLGDLDARLGWMEAELAAFQASDDPFIQLAVALHDTLIEREEAEKDRDGRMQALRPAYMEAITAWADAEGRAIYPDANGTLRVTYGTVFGGSPADGLIYEPFTRLEGIADKHTGEEPFDAPDAQLALIEARTFGDYALDAIGSVPVNFLSNLDVTGGNSGSATLNARGDLVGLLFDMTIESVNSDWNYSPRTARTIHVDSRYMLWVMEYLDDAGHLIEEMDIVRE